MWAETEMCIGMMKMAGPNAKTEIGTRLVGIVELPQQTWPVVAIP